MSSNCYHPAQVSAFGSDCSAPLRPCGCARLDKIVDNFGSSSGGTETLIPPTEKETTTMITLNGERFDAVAAEAYARAKSAPQDATRWQNAITKATEFLNASALWHLMDDDTLLIVSPQSFEVYETAGDSCERIDAEKRTNCPAFDMGRPCWHRAARKLLLNYASE